jgi:hypothetical protein
MERVDVNGGRKKRMTLVNTVMIRRLRTTEKVLLGGQLSAFKPSLCSMELFRHILSGVYGNNLHFSLTLAKCAIKVNEECSYSATQIQACKINIV